MACYEVSQQNRKTSIMAQGQQNGRDQSYHHTALETEQTQFARDSQ